MKTPPQFVVFRLAAGVMTVLILLTAGLGLAARGPLGGLGVQRSRVVNLVRDSYQRGWFG
ncbi:MAG: hypothetical protein ACRDPY_20940 [Streptosporangiaceae bacterium]